jgi:hypothetical protein
LKEGVVKDGFPFASQEIFVKHWIITIIIFTGRLVFTFSLWLRKRGKRCLAGSKVLGQIGELKRFLLD